jgi:hypothetical protein
MGAHQEQESAFQDLLISNPAVFETIYQQSGNAERQRLRLVSSSIRILVGA